MERKDLIKVVGIEVADCIAMRDFVKRRKDVKRINKMSLKDVINEACAHLESYNIDGIITDFSTATLTAYECSYVLSIIAYAWCDKHAYKRVVGTYSVNDDNGYLTLDLSVDPVIYAV